MRPPSPLAAMVALAAACAALVLGPATAARAATVLDSPSTGAAAAPTAGQQRLCTRFLAAGRPCTLAGLLDACTGPQSTDCRDSRFAAWRRAGHSARTDPVAPQAGGGQDSGFRRVAADPPPTGGQLDPLDTLGLGSPLCQRPDISAAARANCARSGAIESAYPLTSYGLDINVKTGVTHIEGDIASALQSGINMIWLAFLYCLRGILTVLEWAFDLDPFGPTAMPKIAVTLTRVYQAVGSPWLVSAMAALGAWAAWHGLARRRHAEAITGTLASVAMIVLAMWVVRAPAQTIGTASAISNQGALALIATTSSGSPTRPAASFADALRRVFGETVTRPWAALNFGDVHWALQRPEDGAVKAAHKKAAQDSQLQAAYANSGGQPAHVAAWLDRQPPPRSRAELYLAYSPGSPPRRALWSYYHGSGDRSIGPISLGFGAKAGKAPDKVAIQDTGGVATRFALLALVLTGLAGVVMLLAWLSLRLIVQATVGFALLLATPVALLFPAFGEHGRESFALWGKTLIGTVLSKLIYAAFLAICVLGLALIGSLGGASWGLAWVLQAVFAWGVFLKRTQILAAASIGPDRRHDSTRDALVGGYLGYRVGRDVVRGVRGHGRALARRAEAIGERRAQRAGEDSAAVCAHARDRLGERADRMAAVELREGQATLRSRDALRRDERELSQMPELRENDAARQREAAGGPKEPVPPETAALVERRARVRDELEQLREPARRAEAQAQQAARNEGQHGRALSDAERRERADRMRKELELPASDPAHAWRAGLTRQEFRELPDTERAARVREIERQLAEDRELLQVVPPVLEGAARPSGVQERRVRERMSHRELRERRKAARDEANADRRRLRRHVPPRR